jgi:hypothetical protein
MKRSIFLILAILVFISLACTVTVPPISTIQPGESKILNIDETYPEKTDPFTIHLSMGAGKLNIDKGDAKIIEGTVQYNIPSWQPSVTRSSGKISIDQNANWKAGIPTGELTNKWDLKLGERVPINLVLDAGAYEGTLNLGGIPLTRLEINDGASNAKVRFDDPNPKKMSLLSYKTGASSVGLYGLGNANFNEMLFEGGAGSYTLDFAGQLQQNARVRIRGGVSSTKIIIPEQTNCTITVSGGLNNVNISGTWNVRDGVYEAKSNGPQLTIDVDLGVGNLDLVRE